MTSKELEPLFTSKLKVRPALFETLDDRVATNNSRPGGNVPTWKTAVFQALETLEDKADKSRLSTEISQDDPSENTPLEAEMAARGSHEEAMTDTLSEVPCATCEEKDQKHALQMEALEARLGAPYQASIQGFEDATFSITRQMHLDVVTLATRMAETILKHEVSFDKEQVITSAEAALHSAGPIQNLVLRCNEQDLENLESHTSRLRDSASPKLISLTLEASKDVALGGVLVVFEEGTVDARLESQLNHLSQAIKATLLGPRELQDEETK